MRAFLKLYHEGVIIEAVQFRELLDIAMVPHCKFPVYKEMRAKYNSIISRNVKTLPPRPPDMSMDIGSQDAQNVMRSVFGAMKRGMGYG